MMVFLPFAGGTSDRVGRKPMWWFSLVGLFIAGVPMFMLMSTGVVGAIIGFAVLGLLYVPQLATISATFPAMFPTHVRYAGFAIAYNVSTSLFGGTAPAVNDWLVNKTGDNLVPAYYMMAACVIGAIALIKVPETTRCPINGTGTPGTADAPPALEYQKQPSRV
jgi:MFS transporter, MHS family, proline/betaine transporter